MKESIKTFILDSSVIINAPYSIFSFDEHTVVLADAVIDDISKLKSSPGETGRNAQEALRLLDDLRQQGDLKKGVLLPGGGKIVVEMNHHTEILPDGWNDKETSTRLLKIAVALSDDNIILVSNDLTLRIKANLLGIAVEGYRTDQAKEDYIGRCEITLDRSDALDEIYRQGVTASSREQAACLTYGQYVLLRSPANLSQTALAWYDGKVFQLIKDKHNPYGIRPRNVGQKFAIDALLAPPDEVPLVLLKGPAGTAKTLLALACGLSQTIDKNPIYDRILVTRPNCKFDEDIGFLKGTEEDKIGPLIRPIWDNLEQLTRIKDKKDGVKMTSYAQTLFDNGSIVAQAMAYMRGRSIANTWIIIDEAQNMTPLQAFGITSRVGAGSKIILAGDPDQVDNPYLNRWNNGLSFASDRMKGSRLCRQVTFSDDECERSPLALEAIKRLTTLKSQCQ